MWINQIHPHYIPNLKRLRNLPEHPFVRMVTGCPNLYRQAHISTVQCRSPQFAENTVNSVQTIMYRADVSQLFDTDVCIRCVSTMRMLPFVSA